MIYLVTTVRLRYGNIRKFPFHFVDRRFNMSTVKVTIDEKQPLLANTSAKRVTIAEPSDDNITPTPSKSNPVPPSPSKSSPPAEDYTGGIYIMLFITFLASVCFSIVLPSIWPFMQNKMHAEKSIVGWAVAVNSGGSFLASPVFGAWGDRRTTREVLGVTLVLMIIGNVMYSLSENIYMLLAGRFVVGVAAANYAVAQTYISYATTPDNRTKIMAYNSAANVLGFIIGPSLALLFTVFHYNVAGVELNDYTMPGYFSAVLSLLGLFSLVTLKEISASTKRQKKPPTSGSTKYATGSGFYSGGGSVKDISQIIKMKKDIPVFPVVVSLIAYFAYTASFTVFETIGTPYTQEDFNWSVTENSILYAVLGVLCIISLVVLQIFVRFFNDRVLVVGTTVFMVAGFGVLFDIQNHLVSLPRFAIGVGLTAAGYSTSVAVLISIYSKVLEGLDQGMMMGWLSSAGSIARIIGPVFASYSFAWGGGRLVFASMMGLMFVVFVILVASYRALKPRTGQEPIN